MNVFSELYGSYYNCMAEIIRLALEGRATDEEISGVIARKGYAETVLTLMPAITEERYRLIRKDGTTPIKNVPEMPLTTLQKRWLKSISEDPRFKLFGETLDIPEDTEPLFRPEDIRVYDRYSDGDPYEDENYIRVFGICLSAIRSGIVVKIGSVNRNGHRYTMKLRPVRLEYSEKDDKFRLLGISQTGRHLTVNLARIEKVEPSVFDRDMMEIDEDRRAEVVFELRDQRKALERVLLHFAHFEKEVIHTGGDLYKVRLIYDPADETELVIRFLSFGPAIKVLEPSEMAEAVASRIRKQMKILGL